MRSYVDHLCGTTVPAVLQLQSVWYPEQVGQLARSRARCWHVGRLFEAAVLPACSGAAPAPSAKHCWRELSGLERPVMLLTWRFPPGLCPSAADVRFAATGVAVQLAAGSAGRPPDAAAGADQTGGLQCATASAVACHCWGAHTSCAGFLPPSHVQVDRPAFLLTEICNSPLSTWHTTPLLSCRSRSCGIDWTGRGARISTTATTHSSC